METLMMAAAVLVAMLGYMLAAYVRQQRAGYEECEVCGKRSRTNVTLTSAPKQRVVDGMLGGSSISATFCQEHAPPPV